MPFKNEPTLDDSSLITYLFSHSPPSPKKKHSNLSHVQGETLKIDLGPERTRISPKSTDKKKTAAAVFFFGGREGSIC